MIFENFAAIEMMLYVQSKPYKDKKVEIIKLKQV